MRIFVSYSDQTGQKRSTRLHLHDYSSTTPLLKLICKELSLNRTQTIIKLKNEPINLVILQNWPLTHYPIKNGSIFTVEVIEHSNPILNEPLQKIEEQFLEEQQAFSSSNHSSNEKGDSKRVEHKYGHYLQESLNKMLERVRSGNLAAIAEIMKEEPLIQDEKELEELFAKKSQYLLNELGDCGRNSLHWAIHISNPEIVSFLLIKGASPVLTTLDHYTPLQLAVLHHSPEILALLLQQPNIDFNYVTEHGSALHLAVRNQDTKCLELLLQHDACVETINNEGKTPIDICSNQKILQMLNRKAELGKMPIPYIAKGDLFRVSSTTYRLKDRLFLLNPFKNEFTISLPNGQVQEKIQLSSICSVEEVQQKSWLMKSSLSYFRIGLKSIEKGLMFAVTHDNICKRWVHHLTTAIKYVVYSQYAKAVAPGDQAVECMDDKKGEIVLHKRKVEQKSAYKNSPSIMNMTEKETPKKTELKTTSGESDSSKSIQEDRYKESEIILGSIIEINKVQSPSVLRCSFESKVSSENQEDFSHRFRKHSESRVGEVSEFVTQAATSISYNDFILVRQLGTGAFGKVYLAKHKPTGFSYALKVLNKRKLFAKKQLKYAVGETTILKKMNCPFIVKLYYAFQTPSNLYMALDNCTLGDLAELIAARDYLREHTARFVIAQLILAIQYLHQHKILYRDLKPENILIDSDGYIKLTDFGLSRENSFAASFCGSPAYLSPEMLQKKGVGHSSDIYGIGCVLYEMVVGEPPYFNEDMQTLFQNIKTGKLRFPSKLTLQIKSLISKLLQRDINKRLGVKDINEIKNHQFFKKFDWGLLERKKMPVPSEMFTNMEEQMIDGIELEVNQEIKLIDQDYNEATKMINRIKNFTFVREIEEPQAKVPAVLTSIESR